MLPVQVYVFDYSKHPSKPDPGGKCTPNLRLLGHRMEGYGMAWSPHRAGNLLSGSDDAQICLWDVNAANAGHELNALQIWSQHGGVVEVRGDAKSETEINLDGAHQHRMLLGTISTSTCLGLWVMTASSSCGIPASLKVGCLVFFSIVPKSHQWATTGASQSPLCKPYVHCANQYNNTTMLQHSVHVHRGAWSRGELPGLQQL